MKSNKIILTIVSVIVLCGLIWYFFLRKTEQPVTLSTEKPTTGDISTSVTATGTIQPVDTVTVGTQVSGTLSAMYADFNSIVKKGQLLAELDKVLLQATVDQYKAGLAQAQSTEIYQSANFKRQQQLFATGAISKADYDLALSTYQAAKASVNSVKAQLRSAERNMSFTQIYSPIDGVVLSRSVSVGQTVAASYSTPTIFTIAKDITKMQVEADVDEADIGEVVKGLRATFTVDAFINDVFNGTVKEVRLNPAISSNVVTYTTLIEAPNDDKKLKPGMTASIVIYTKEVKDALLISAKALKFSPDSNLTKQYTIVPAAKDHDTAAQKKIAKGETTKVTDNYIWVLQGNQLIQKKVIVGLNDNTHVQVLEGLTAEEIVATGTATVTADAPQASSSPFMPKRPGKK